MSQLLIIYEITERAAKVTSKKALKEYETWVKHTLKTYQDAALERVARIQLFKLKEQFSFVPGD